MRFVLYPEMYNPFTNTLFVMAIDQSQTWYSILSICMYKTYV